MYHFFVERSQIEGDQAYITGKDVNHIGNVLRMKPGEKLMISAGEDWEYLCAIREIGKTEVFLDVIEENRDVRELPVAITLYQGLPKADKMELIIQKAVELGVRRIVPVETKRCVVKLDQRKAEAKRKRWQMIAESAAKQSGRKIIPEVMPPLSFPDALRAAGQDERKLIPYERAENMEETRRRLSNVCPGDRISIIIGPEGGFEEEEIELARNSSFSPVTLGKRILRTETAGFVILSCLMMSVEGRA